MAKHAKPADKIKLKSFDFMESDPSDMMHHSR